jgi:hypothetical protein
MEAVAGLIGVVLGAVISAFGSWWLERRRDSRAPGWCPRPTSHGIGRQQEEDQDRRREVDGPVPQEDWGGLLTLGNWDANKATFAQLMHDESLWEEVVRTYADIYEATSARQDPPEVRELTALARKLAAERDKRLRQRSVPTP